MSDALSRHGVFAAYAGNAPQVMRFMPPLSISEEEMEAVIDAVGSAVASVHRLLSPVLPVTAVPGVVDLLNDESVQTGLFGLVREVEDMGQEMKDSSKGVGRSAKDWVGSMEPKLQELVAAMLRAGQKVDGAAGPVVRPHYRRARAAASSAAGQAAQAAGKVSDSLPAPVKDALKEGRMGLFTLHILDWCMEDGDVVALSVDGMPIGQVMITHAGADITIPLKQGQSQTLTVTAVHDGGGGVTFGASSSLGDMRTRSMAVGESETWIISFE